MSIELIKTSFPNKPASLANGSEAANEAANKAAINIQQVYREYQEKKN